MCGRYGLTIAQDELALALEVERIGFEWGARYNIAPTQDAPVLRVDDGGRRLDLMRWGLVPFWAKDIRIGSRMINARSETVPSKPAFRAAFRARRCLVPVSGFYEWSETPEGKYPFWIYPEGAGIMTLAGLWESWTPREGNGGAGRDPVETFTILTTSANELIAPLHDRMPVVVPDNSRSAWLDPSADPPSLEALFDPRPGIEFDVRRVSRHVNSPRNEGPDCLAPPADS